jgi:hypothetical protein
VSCVDTFYLWQIMDVDEWIDGWMDVGDVIDWSGFGT